MEKEQNELKSIEQIPNIQEKLDKINQLEKDGKLEPFKPNVSEKEKKIVGDLKHQLENGNCKLGVMLEKVFCVNDDDYDDDENEFPSLPFADI